MKRNKQYIEGFKHGVNWALIMVKVNIEDIRYNNFKKVLKSLKEGR